MPRKDKLRKTRQADLTYELRVYLHDDGSVHIRITVGWDKPEGFLPLPGVATELVHAWDSLNAQQQNTFIKVWDWAVDQADTWFEEQYPGAPATGEPL